MCSDVSRSVGSTRNESRDASLTGSSRGRQNADTMTESRRSHKFIGSCHPQAAYRTRFSALAPRHHDAPLASSGLPGLSLAVERAAGSSHLDQDLGRREAVTVLGPQPLTQLDEGLGAHEIDVAGSTARVGRESEAEDRADIRLARVGDHAFLDAAGRLERLRDEETLLQLLHVEKLALAMRGLQILQARPQAFWAVFRIIVEALPVLAAEPSLMLDHGDEELLLVRVHRRLAHLGLRGLDDL